MKRIMLAVSMLLLIATLSCTDTVAPVLTGDITGFVFLQDHESQQIKDRSGVKVSIEGRQNFTYTDSNGKYRLENISAGIFNIVFEKEGYGLYKIIAREFPGGGEAYLHSLTLFELPAFEVSSVTIVKSSNNLIIQGSVTGVLNYYRNVLIFFDKTSNVSNDPKNYLTLRSGYVYADSSQFSSYIFDYKNWFINKGFLNDSTIYLAAYSSTDYWGGYPDPETGRYFYTGVGSNPVKESFILD